MRHSENSWEVVNFSVIISIFRQRLKTWGPSLRDIWLIASQQLCTVIFFICFSNSSPASVEFLFLFYEFSSFINSPKVSWASFEMDTCTIEVDIIIFIIVSLVAKWSSQLKNRPHMYKSFVPGHMLHINHKRNNSSLSLYARVGCKQHKAGTSASGKHQHSWFASLRSWK